MKKETDNSRSDPHIFTNLRLFGILFVSVNFSGVVR